MAGFAVDFHMPAGLLDEAEHHAEPEAGSLAGRFGCEKRLKNPLYDLGRHAGSGIAHRNHDVLPRRDLLVPVGVGFVEINIGALNRQLAAVRHGVARIEHEIEQRRFKLVRVERSATTRRAV